MQQLPCARSDDGEAAAIVGDILEAYVVFPAQAAAKKVEVVPLRTRRTDKVEPVPLQAGDGIFSKNGPLRA